MNISSTHIPEGYIPVVIKDYFVKNTNPISQAVRTLIPEGYRKPIMNKTTVDTRSNFIDLVNKPKLKTFTPDDYVRCEVTQEIMVFRPYIKWYCMIKKVKQRNTPRVGGAGFEDVMENLLGQAKELLTVKTKK